MCVRLLISVILLKLLASDVKCFVCNDTFYWVPKIDGKVKRTTIANVTEICKKVTCITKCCLTSQVHLTSSLDMPGCKSIAHVKEITNYEVDKLTNFDYSELYIYKLNNSNDLEKTKLTHKNMTVRFNGKFYQYISDCTSGLHAPGVEDDQQYFLLEGGTLVTEKPNFYVRYPEWGKENFCFEYLVDHFVNKTDDSTKLSVKMHFLTFPKSEPPVAGQEAYMNFKIVAFIVSSFFLLLVLVVYGSLRELQGIGGMVQMAYCATYMAALILNAALLAAEDAMNSDSCRYIMIVNYFLLFSSFFWMNIMSFDIWWTFRGWFKQRRIHRQGVLVKFGWYSLYAWGTPLLITTVVAIIDNSDLRKYPHIIKPFFENCFRDSTEIKFYYNIPIGILLFANIFFFALTAYNYWRIKKDLDRFKDSDAGNRSVRFKMYLKLAVIMGVGWIFDVFVLPGVLQMITEVYNGLIGITIFLVFVFKRKILIRICQRYGLHHRFKFVQDLERRWSTSTKSQSQKRSLVESESNIPLEPPQQSMTMTTTT